MPADRREYMKQYRARQAAAKVLPMHEQFEHCTNSSNTARTGSNTARTGSNLEPQGFHQSVTNTAVTVTNMFEQCTNTVEKQCYTAVMLILIIITTAALIKEQANFYQIRGETTQYSFLWATLTEVVALCLSFFATRFRRPGLSLLLIPIVAASLCIIYLGLDRKSNGEEIKIRATTILEAEIKGLEDQIPILEEKGMTTALIKIKAKLAEKREELRASLSVVGSSVEIWVLTGLRVLAVFWNIAFASLIAFIWRNPSES